MRSFSNKTLLYCMELAASLAMVAVLVFSEIRAGRYHAALTYGAVLVVGVISFKFGITFMQYSRSDELELSKFVSGNNRPIQTTDVTIQDKKITTESTINFVKDHPQYPEELDIALQAWRGVQGVASTKQPKEQLYDWLKRNYPDTEILSLAARDRIVLICNWNKKGGAPKTPG